ncbi:hypothetical protein [Mycolicibacter terrae]|uniref:hypothetical protein n=1 Tax=Mycolicibacter terrae TaxID=1788 RepID=UPI000A22B826|nr:hypothetical protein [Mycolicibacter terrae]ORW90709.1 hypothetical protein AWC28_02635 [Mycolicibacter terrae]SNV91874.1 transmembrane protein [Mycolicibacter terrae]
MTSRLLPYATSPGRLLAQLFSDAVVAVWTFLWVLVALAVHGAVATIAGVGRQFERGANGVAESLASAGHSADRIPLVGDAVSKPLTAAGEAAVDIAGAGHNLNTTAGWLAYLLAIAVAAPPILAVAMPWLALRLRFFLRKRAVLTLAATPAGEQLLALRALSNRPLGKLTAVSPDPVGAWRHADRAVIAGLAALELHSAGLARRSRRAPAP